MAFDFTPGQDVEYAAHRVSWQDDGTAIPTGEEDWQPATVIDVFEHPPHHGEEHRWVPMGAVGHPLSIGTIDLVVRLQPEDGQPPLDLNIKLVRPR